MEETAWANALDVIKKYVVKVETQNGFGTGFLVKTYEEPDLKDFIAIATAWHVIDHADTWKQSIKISHLESGKNIFLEGNERIIWKEITMDSSLIIFNNSKTKLSLPDSSLPFIKTGRRLREGIEIGWCGYPVLSPSNLSFFSGRISVWLEKQKSYLVDGVAINGVSGGPAFNLSKIKERKLIPQIVGILTAYIPNIATGGSLPGVSFVRCISTCLSLSSDFQNRISKLDQEEKNKRKKK